MTSISEQDQLLLINSLLPQEIGQIFKQKVSYTCLDVTDRLLAVGSEQGHVWILDTSAKKIIKEFSETRAAVTVVKLHKEHNIVAYGTEDGFVHIINFTKSSVKQVSKERDQQKVCVLHWSTSGTQIFAGYASGKILSFSLSFEANKISMDSSLLYDCKSEIVQLVQRSSLLLISTVLKPVLLDLKTSQITQIGSRERKPGCYGGTFTNLSGSAVIARPGLRLWIANEHGKVQSTIKFKEVLTMSPVSPMPLYGGIIKTSPPDDSWQFTKLVPWRDEWIVSCHGNTVWVLEPDTLSCKGMMTLGQVIVDIAVNKQDLYLLIVGHQRALVKLSLAAVKQPVRDIVVMEKRKAEVEVEEMKEKIKEEKKTEETETDFKEEVLQKIDIKEEIKQEMKEEDVIEKVEIKEEEKTEETETEEVLHEIDVKQEVLQEIDVEKMLQKITVDVNEEATATGGSMTEMISNETELIDVVTDGKRNDTPLIHDCPAIIVTNEEKLATEDKRNVLNIVGSGLSDLREKISQPLGKLAAVKLRHDADISPDREEEKQMTNEALNSIEVNRRYNMTHIEEDNDDVAVHSGVKKKKTKKKVHRKKHKLTPASSTHSSVDNLLEIDSASSTPMIEHKDINIDELILQTKSLESVETEIQIPLDEETVEEQNEQKNDRNEIESPSLKDKQDYEVEDEIIQTVLPDQDVEQSLLFSSLGARTLTRDTAPLLTTSSPTTAATPPTSPQTVTPPTEPRGRSRAFLIMDPVDNPLYEDEKYLFQEEEEEILGAAATKLTSSEPKNIPDSGAHRSHSISSSYSDTIGHPLESGGSNSETDEEMSPKNNTNDSIVAPDFYSLVGKLVGESRQAKETDVLQHQELQSSRVRTGVGFANRGTEYVSPLRRINENMEENLDDDLLDIQAQSADIWCPVPQPSNNGIQSISLSLTSLWLVDQKRTVYWSNPLHHGSDWHAMKKHMSQVSTSSNGKVVWGVYHQQAYARSGISDINPAGTTWSNFTRKSHISRHVRAVSCDNNKVWALLTDGKVLCRKGVSENHPDGKMWVEVTPPNSFVQIACCNDVVWALDQSHSAYVREGITHTTPTGSEWKKVQSPSFVSVSVVDTGVVWGIGLNNSRVWFRCGANSLEPGGAGPWWEVSIGTLNNSSTSQDPLWKVMSFERSSSILQSFSSFLSPVSSNQRILAVTACAETGVCLLTSDNQLHACWKLANGYHYDQICSHPIFNMTIWKNLTTGNLTQWIVRDDGELYCIVSGDGYVHVECQSFIEALASSPSALWVLSKGQIWSRQGISQHLPQGYSWEYIELGSHMQEFVVHLSIGDKVAWAVDKAGHVHFRFGTHPREPGTGMSPAWIQVDDQSESQILFGSISVSCDDWLVWGVDVQNFPYVRKGVTPDYPVGNTWELVTGQQVKRIATSCGKVYALSPSGELLCRHGITERNPAGNYWRRLPGNFEEIACNPSGEVWLVDGRGNVKKQRGKLVSVCSDLKRQKEKDELEMSMTVDEWEVL